MTISRLLFWGYSSLWFINAKKTKGHPEAPQIVLISLLNGSLCKSCLWCYLLKGAVFLCGKRWDSLGGLQMICSKSTELTSAPNHVHIIVQKRISQLIISCHNTTLHVTVKNKICTSFTSRSLAWFNSAVYTRHIICNDQHSKKTSYCP